MVEVVVWSRLGGRRWRMGARRRFLLPTSREQDHGDDGRQQQAGTERDVLAAQPPHARGSACCPRRRRAAARARRSGSGERARSVADEHDLDGRLGAGAPRRVRRERPCAALRPHPVADALAVQHELARGAALVGRPLTLGAERPVRHAHGRHPENGAQMEREPATPRVIPARRVHEQHVREGAEPMDRALEQRALPQCEPSRRVAGRSLAR